LSTSVTEPRARITHIDQAPGRLLAAINQVPTWVFRLHLSRLFGDRFAMITHRGRKSGQPRTVIVETADGSVAEGRLIYIVAFGSQAQWYKNLEAAPAIRIEIAGRVYPEPRHEFLGPEDTKRAIASYWARYPRLARLLARNGVFFYPGPVADHPRAPRAVAFYLGT
jgi:deazaflavin-dependent oxidoreductase (nitroreductase family)